MQRKYLLVLTVLIIILVTILVLYTFGVTDRGKRIEFQTISKGCSSGHTNQAYYVVQDALEWKHLWNQHTTGMLPQPPPPEVNFSKTAIIAVFMGTFATSGYEIEVKEIIEMGRWVVVKAEKTYPSEKCGGIDVLSQPYHIVRVDKTNLYVIFDTFTTIKECS